MPVKPDIPLEKRIIFALDCPSLDTARAWVERLESRVRFYKVGLELFLAGCWDAVEWIRARGHEVMLDLKFFDVPATVERAMSQVSERGVSLVTVHGNDAILRAAGASKGATRVLAVTVLTSLDEGDLRDLGFVTDPESLVLSRARRALEAGCDGVVSSGLEALRLRQELGDRLLVVCPGIRPVANVDDQRRTVDARRAISNGADYLVVGRPIRDAADPLAAVALLQGQIREALASKGPAACP